MPPYYRVELNGYRGLGYFDPDDIQEYREQGARIHEFAVLDVSSNGATPASSPDTTLIDAHSAQEASHDTVIDNAIAEADGGPDLALELDLPDAGGSETV